MENNINKRLVLLILFFFIIIPIIIQLSKKSFRILRDSQNSMVQDNFTI